MQNLAQRRAESPRLTQPADSPAPAPAEPVLRPRSKPTPEGETAVHAFARQFAEWGIEEAFGVSGGAIALLFDAIAESPIHLRHFRHETGAAFAACEAHFATEKPTLVFATTGPGLLNALNGITAAKWEGAKVILVSGYTSSPQRGRWATQESSPYTLPQDALYSAGPIFDFAVRMESSAELPQIFRRLALGLAKPGGFVAHVALPMAVQSSRVELERSMAPAKGSVPTCRSEDLAQIAALLHPEPFAIWVGFGATRSAAKVRELVQRTGAKVFCSPRAKGIIPEDHPQYLGVTGLGGHDGPLQYMVQQKPKWTLVLGTRLGEATSFWDRDLLPSEGLIHVDIDPEAPGTSFPDFPTLAVHAEIDAFLDGLLDHFPTQKPKHHSNLSFFPPQTEIPVIDSADRSPVRPQLLMSALQRSAIDEHDALIMAECGNSFAWCNHYLRFKNPQRYRVSTLFGSMGHTASGVVGAAIASGRKTVAVVGDGSMLMNAEVSTAVQYQAPAVWVVLNDAGYGMCRDGHAALGLTSDGIDLPRVEFVAWARAMGADGTMVEAEHELEKALKAAMEAPGPYVVDVRIDPNEASPLLRRFESLIKQGNSKHVAGWER